jgi:MOSC domain-containing protein YiiM
MGIYIAPSAGAPMQEVEMVEAINGHGLVGDRYCSGDGSFNKGVVGRRQVTFINSRFFIKSGFSFDQCRRNIITFGVELNGLIGKEFAIGTAQFRGVKYCDPCNRPSRLVHHSASFMEVFSDCGGIIAEVIKGGALSKHDHIIILGSDS